MSDLEASSSTPPLHAEVRDKVETLIAKLEETSVGFYGYQEGYLAKEPEPYDVQECADEVLQAVADALMSALPEKHEPENRHLSTDNGGFLGNYCNRCKIFTFDKDTFEETGAWCLCYPYNEALDAVTRVIGELGGRRNHTTEKASGS